MNRYKFLSMSRGQQVRVLKVHGKILHRRLKGKYHVYLYEFKNFYIELWYDDMQSQLDDMVTFKDRSLINYQYNMVSDQVKH